MRSLKHTSYFAFIGVAVLLCFVIILGIRQYQLTERYNSIITQSEKMIFQFSTIREQITISLIKQDWYTISTAADQLKNLNSSLARLQENTLIPGEYRLDMARQIDISGLAIASKEIASSTDKVAHSLILHDKMRILAEYLLQFDRIIVSQMKAKVVGFQTVMIGALGAIICLISFSLILLYKKALIPLLQLRAQTENPDIHTSGFYYDKETCSEITIFVDSVNTLLEEMKAHPEAHQDSHILSDKLATIINESNNLSNGIINYAQLLKDSYREVEIGGEETKILQNIIEAAERIALLNKEI
jgi:signal transduction histidine kinase